MSYWIAGIDVHKRMLAVVVADVAVEEVVMESTAQYWRPVWETLERYWQPRRSSGRAQSRCRAPCIWRRPSRITGRVGGRKISRMPNAW